MFIRLIPFFALLFVLFSCDSETIAKIDKTNVQLSNGIHLVIEKTNKESSHIGIFSKHDYGSTHSFSYKLFIIDKDVSWDGGSGEPKNLIFCEDSIFLHSYKEKLFSNDSLVRKDSTIAYESYYEVVEVFQKHIDNRYFFNKMGEEYWLDISEKEYQSKREICKEFFVPNDGELNLTKKED